ncbi:MAG: hypothetical protein IJN65_05105 [Clostridia bacterium]|nr:hypothetical protein [Clostridia bacterium]
MRKRSIMLIIATVLSTAYAVYLICYFFGAMASANDSTEAIAGGIATALVTPHTIMFVLGAMFGWLGIIIKKSWSALVAAILYCVGSLLFLAYIMFGAPILILGFIGYANQKKLNKKNLAQSIVTE